MRRDLLDFLLCPNCRADLTVEVGVADGVHVTEGKLQCEQCGDAHPIIRGVPRMNCSDGELAGVAQAFTYQWDAYHRGSLTRDGAYGARDEELWRQFQAATGLQPADLAGLSVLDAGCGHAHLCSQVARHGARAVVALDLSETVDAVYRLTRSLPNLHVVQGNLLDAPVRSVFDVVWSAGAIHMTPDTVRAFRALTRYVRPGGLLFVWVYAERFNPYLSTRAVLTRLGLRHVPDAAVFALARALSYPSVPLHLAYRGARCLPGLKPTTGWAQDTVRRRGRREFHMEWNDYLAPPYTSTHSEEDVIGWFHDAGFTDVVTLDEPKVGVRGRAPLNPGKHHGDPVPPQSQPQSART